MLEAWEWLGSGEGEAMNWELAQKLRAAVEEMERHYIVMKEELARQIELNSKLRADVVQAKLDQDHCPSVEERIKLAEERDKYKKALEEIRVYATDHRCLEMAKAALR